MEDNSIKQARSLQDHEILDIYDENAEPTGKTVLRGTPIKNGEYSLSVHMFIYNPKGMFILQKRSKKKKSLPGVWGVTCGAVSTGEDSISAGIREAKEELGLQLEPDSFEFVEKIKRRYSFVDIYFVKAKFDISKCILQKDEVESIKLSSPKELLNIILSSPNTNSTYSAAVKRAMKERGLI
jgi:isopentenyldiphosphate isomerase